MSDENTRKPGRLRKLRISRVDRVSAGANPDAHVVLYKREELPENVAIDASDVLDYEAPTRADERLPSEEHHMTDEQTTEATPETVDERIAALEAERDAAIAKIAEMEAAAATDDEQDDENEDDVMKSLDPSVRERIAKAEAERAALAERVAKMEDEAATREFVAKAATFATIEKDADRLGGILKDVSKHCGPETVDALETILKSATARLDEATRLITAEIGTAAAIDQTDAGQQIESLAKARAAETGESMPVATAAILNDQPHLYEQARAERGL